MSVVRRYRVPTLPGRPLRDCVEVVKASDYDERCDEITRLRAENERLRLLLQEVADAGQDMGGCVDLLNRIGAVLKEQP